MPKPVGAGVGSRDAGWTGLGDGFREGPRDPRPILGVSWVIWGDGLAMALRRRSAKGILVRLL